MKHSSLPAIGVYITSMLLMNALMKQDSKIYAPFTAFGITSIFYLFDLAFRPLVNPARENIFRLGRSILMTLIAIITIHLVTCSTMLPALVRDEAQGNAVRFQQIMIRSFVLNLWPAVALFWAALIAPAIDVLSTSKRKRVASIWIYFFFVFFEFLFLQIAIPLLFPKFESDPKTELIGSSLLFFLASIVPALFCRKTWRNAMHKLNEIAVVPSPGRGEIR